MIARRRISLLAAAAALAIPGVVSAAPPSVSQYVETIPTASGSAPVTPAPHPSATANSSPPPATSTPSSSPAPVVSLPKAVVAKVHRSAGSDATPLIRIATSKSAGAPASSAVAAATIGSTGRFWLDRGGRWQLAVLALVLIAVAGGAVAVARRR